MDVLLSTWPWYLSGPLIALTMFLLLFVGKKFGMSSNLKTVCSIGGAGKFADFFKDNWREKKWNLMVVLGAIIGGYIAANFMPNNQVDINPALAQKLQSYGIDSAGDAYLPPEIFDAANLNDPFILFILLIGDRKSVV